MNDTVKKATKFLTEQLDEETTEVLLQEAKKTFPTIFETYKTAFDNKDLVQAKFDIHSLKGALQAMGLKEEANLVIEIEKKLQNGDLDKELDELNLKLTKIILDLS